jgi:hypothetical protein
MATGLGPAAGGMGHVSRLLDTSDADSQLKDQPLKERLKEWAKDESAGVLAIRLKSPPAARPAGYMAKAYTIAEHLEYLSDAAGIPVVADAFRQPASTEQYMTGATVGEYVQSLKSGTMSTTRQGYFRTENGWLMFRHPHFWRMQTAEIPEKAFETLEAKSPGGGFTLDEYAAFANSLTPSQVEAFLNFPPVTRFPRVPLVAALPALRLWGALNGGQRQSAYEDGVGYQSMTVPQRELYRQAILDLMWMRPVREAMLPLLIKGDSKKEIGLWMRDGSNNDGILGSISNSQESIGPPEKPQTLTVSDLQEMASRSVAFLLGESQSDAECFSFILVSRGK